MTSPIPSHWTVSSSEQGLRLDLFLAAPERLGSRSRVRAAINRGKVFLNDREVASREAGAQVRRGDVVRVWMDRPGSARRRSAYEVGPLRVVYEDEVLIVVDKPAGLLAVPLGRRKDAASVYSHLADHLGARGRQRPHVVHRIDRDTSGLVVFAKTAQAQQLLKEQFSRREPERVYRAVVMGCPTPAKGQWRDRLAWDAETLRQHVTTERNPTSSEAVSDYEVLETFGGASLIEVRLVTGKRNQIRIQAALRGHPLVGERQYAELKTRNSRLPTEIPELPRQALHAYRLVLRHPADNRPLTFEAPLPRDLLDLLSHLRRNRPASSATS